MRVPENSDIARGAERAEPEGGLIVTALLQKEELEKEIKKG